MALGFNLVIRHCYLKTLTQQTLDLLQQSFLLSILSKNYNNTAIFIQVARTIHIWRLLPYVEIRTCVSPLVSKFFQYYGGFFFFYWNILNDLSWMRNVAKLKLWCLGKSVVAQRTYMRQKSVLFLIIKWLSF